MGNEQMIMVCNIIGGIANGIAAICAVVAIVVTVWNFKSDRKEQKREKLSSKLRELYKQTIIDSMLEFEDENIRFINDSLYKMSREKFNETAVKEISEYMMSGVHNCLREVEMVKLFNQELYREIKKITESIFDTYSNTINKAMKNKYISKSYEQQIKEDWIKLKRFVYECYINENFVQTG